MNKFTLLVLILISCKSPIKQEDKIAVIAKIIQRPTSAKNGSETIIYYYLGNQFLSTSSFDARRFSYGDKILIYIDKENPKIVEFPNPDIKLGNFADIQKLKSIQYYTNKEDLKKLDEIE